MKLEKYHHPFIFYGIAVLVPWALWFICAGLSHSTLWDSRSWVVFGSFLGLLGLLVPMITAFALILPDKEMRDELIAACTNFKDVNWKWWAFTFLFPFAVIRFGIDTKWFASSFEFLTGPNFDFTIAPKERIRFTGDMRMDNYRSITDLICEYTLWYRFFDAGHKLGDFAGIGIGFKNDSVDF